MSERKATLNLEWDKIVSYQWEIERRRWLKQDQIRDSLSLYIRESVSERDQCGEYVINESLAETCNGPSLALSVI